MQHSYPCCWRHKTPIIFRARPRSGSSAWIRRASSTVPERIKRRSVDPRTGVRRVLNQWSLTVWLPDCIYVMHRGRTNVLFVHKETRELLPGQAYSGGDGRRWRNALKLTVSGRGGISTRKDPRRRCRSIRRKFRIRWTFGLIPVPPVCSVVDARRNSRLCADMYLEGLTSIAARFMSLPCDD